jgi:hypothetical protein
MNSLRVWRQPGALEILEEGTCLYHPYPRRRSSPVTRGAARSGRRPGEIMRQRR